MNRDSIIDGDWETKEVSIDGKLLSPARSLKVCNHSPDGFCWGYGGSGPAQLALALLLIIITEEEARKYYQYFKFDIIAGLSQGDFELNASKIYDWLETKGKEL